MYKHCLQTSRTVGLSLAAISMIVLLPTVVLSASVSISEYGNTGYHTAHDMLQTDDGCFLLVGTTGINWRTPSKIYLLHVDAQGNQIWDRVLGSGSVTGGGIVQAQDQSFLIVGTVRAEAGDQDALLMCVDRDGNELWSNTWGSELDDYYENIVSTAEGEYYVSGNRVDPNDMPIDPGTAGYDGYPGRSNPVVAKLDGSGTVIWEQVLSSDGNVMATAIAPTEDGGLLVLARELLLPIGHSEMALYKLDVAGDVVWHKTWSEGTTGGYAIAARPDGSSFVAGILRFADDEKQDMAVWSVDAEGNVLWMQRIGDPDCIEGAQLIALSPSGGVFVGGWKSMDFNTYTDEIVVFELDASGQLLWKEEITTDKHQTFATMLATEDNTLRISGATAVPGRSFRIMLVTISLDAIEP